MFVTYFIFEVIFTGNTILQKSVTDEVTFRLESWFIGKSVYREVVIVIDSSISRTLDPFTTSVGIF